MWRKRSAQWSRVVVAAVAAWAAAFPAAAEEELLTLRVNDAAGEPGGLVAVVLRTYAPRGMERGEICIRALTRTKATAATPFAALKSVIVFSDASDAVTFSAFDENAQTALVDFTSASGTVNLSDGPLAVFFFELETSLTPGEEFGLEIDLGATSLTDGDGASIAIEPRAGTLEVRRPGARRLLVAEGDSVMPGDVAVLGVETQEIFAVSGGRVVFRYDPAFAAGPPVVDMDPRHSKSATKFAVDEQLLGEVIVNIFSPDGSLNSEVPGAIITIFLPTSPALPDGSWSPVTLDPVLTNLTDPLGNAIPLELEAGVLDLGAGQILTDGFESGDLSAWTAMVP